MSQSPSFDDIVYANATPDSNSQLSMNPQIGSNPLSNGRSSQRHFTLIASPLDSTPLLCNKLASNTPELIRQPLTTSGFIYSFLFPSTQKPQLSHVIPELIARTSIVLSDLYYQQTALLSQLLTILSSFFSLDEEQFLTSIVLLHRFIQRTPTANNLPHADFLYLLIICQLIAIKILADCPLNIASVSEAFQLDSSRLYANERHVLSSLSYNLFFTEQDVAMLTDIVPSQAWLGLSFASDRSARISFKERTHSGAVLLTQAEQSDLHYHSPSTDLNAVSPLFTPNRHPSLSSEMQNLNPPPRTQKYNRNTRSYCYSSSSR